MLLNDMRCKCGANAVQMRCKMVIGLDRIEIYNPGKLYGNITINDIINKNVSKRRNPLIADIFHKVHYVEKWGTGINKILSLEPKTKFEEFANFFQVIFERKAPVKLSELQKNILNKILKNPYITYDELSTALNANRTTFMRNISKLKNMKIIKRVGSDKGGHWEVIE